MNEALHHSDQVPGDSHSSPALKPFNLMILILGHNLCTVHPVVKEAPMKKHVSRLVLPTALLVFSCAPGFAQIRLGVDLGAVSIRIAPDGPPPNKVERRTAQPSGNHVWIDGYWDRQDDRWAWAPGRWEEPGQPGSNWVKPHYQKEGGATRYEPGHWSHQKMVEGDDYTRWHKEHKN